MKGFINNIEDLAVRNSDFRQVLYTAKHCQLVLMALKPKEDIGAEVHKLSQFFRVEEGSGAAVLDGVTTAISAGFAVLVPAGTKHNIINTGSISMKLYTLYAPPNHRDDIVLDFPRLSRQMIMSEINQRKPVDGRLELAAGLKFDLKGRVLNFV